MAKLNQIQETGLPGVSPAVIQAAHEAMQKRRDGQTLKPREEASIRKYEAEAESARRWQYYQTIPMKDLERLFGSHRKVIYEMAQRYNLSAMAASPVDLEALAHQFRDLLKRHGAAILDSEQIADIDRALKEQKLSDMKRRAQRENGILVDGAKMVGDLQMVMRLVRQCGNILRAKYGPEASQILNDSLDAANRQLEKRKGKLQ
ncbi:MAG: hypothetical protein NTX50_22110 [Candidatus Sumerlaeota bacterium]|nr:hypothetical protein [Candidatus Sumerlaeota bacterium]